MRLIYALLAVAIVCFSLSAATENESDSTPASSNVRGARSPRVFANGRVSFSLKAPDAKSVQVGGPFPGAPFPMTKDAEGVWTTTIPPLVPGFHYYWLLVDGAQMNDPGTTAYFGYGKETSGIEIPEHGVDFYSAKNVMHGEVREHWYLSKTTGDWRRCFVYTPPGYDESAVRYPVLILQHGAGEDETGWTRQGKANFILDNLLAEGKAKPMIIVMDRGYATRAGSQQTLPRVTAQLRFSGNKISL